MQKLKYSRQGQASLESHVSIQIPFRRKEGGVEGVHIGPLYDTTYSKLQNNVFRFEIPFQFSHNVLVRFK